MLTSSETTAIVPPPWRLSGSATIAIYRFSESYVYERVALPPSLSGMFVGGFGAIMLVDYATSPVGPYRELLFSPGQFAYGRKKAHSITHIYVSTEASVVNGRTNWGLPKELADFSIQARNDVHQWRVSQNGQTLLDFTYRPGRLTLPLPGWLYRPRLMQFWQGERYLTRIRAGGRLQLSEVEEPKTGGAFPNIGHARPVGVVHLPHFKLTFPPPQREPAL